MKKKVGIEKLKGLGVNPIDGFERKGVETIFRNRTPSFFLLAPTQANHTP